MWEEQQLVDPPIDYNTSVNVPVNKISLVLIYKKLCGGWVGVLVSHSMTGRSCNFTCISFDSFFL